MALIKLDNPLQNLLLKILGEENKDYITLTLNWSSIVGKYLAENSYVYNIENNVLFIGVGNSVVMQEFCLMRDRLQEKISQQLQIKFKDIIFFIKDDVKKSKDSSLNISRRSK